MVKAKEDGQPIRFDAPVHLDMEVGTGVGAVWRDLHGKFVAVVWSDCAGRKLAYCLEGVVAGSEQDLADRHAAQWWVIAEKFI